MLAKFIKLFLIIVTWFKKIFKSAEKKNEIIPLSVNYHFTRQCNYSCGFCFHTAKTSFVLPLDKVNNYNISLYLGIYERYAFPQIFINSAYYKTFS